jgi:hypothetical protein
MLIKRSGDSDTNEIFRKQDVIRSINPHKDVDTKDPKDIISESILFKYLNNNSLILSYTVIFYVFLYSLLFPPRLPDGDIFITRILINVFSFSFSRVLNDRLWVLTTIIFILLLGLCCVLSVNSILKYFRLRKNNTRYYAFIVFGIFSLVMNVWLLISNLLLLHLLIAGFNRMF